MKTSRATQHSATTFDALQADASTDRSASVRGLSSYDEQVAALSPFTPDDKDPAKDPNEEVGPKDTPGVLYSNTSKTNLNKKSDWHKRLGFSLGQNYQATFTFDDLVLAGRDLKAPTGAATGPVRIEPGANTRDKREYDYIRTPSGAVEETGSHTFAIRGGAGNVGGPVTVNYANNGGLNLARLARSAYELMVAKGVTIQGNVIDYKGQTFALGCTVQMGNEVDGNDARAYGFVGEFEMKWIEEKVSTTVEALVSAYSVAGRDVQTGSPNRGNNPVMHPYYRSAHTYQKKRHVTNAQGGMSRQQGVLPIQSDKFPQSTVRAWGSGKDQRAWMTDPAEIAAVAQRRLKGAWAPGGDWHGHPTYITACPDYTGQLVTLMQTAQGSFDKPAQEVEAMMKVICAELLKADMNHDLITDPALQARVLKTNRAMIKAAFAAWDQTMIKARFEEIDKPQAPPDPKASDKPVEGVEQSGEGLIGLRAYKP